MEMFAPFLFLFLLCGYYDAKHKEVPDIFTAALWVSVALFLPSEAYIAVFSFGGLYFANALVVVLFKTPAMGWADLLMLPPYFACCFGLIAYGFPVITTGIIFALGVYFPSLLAGITKKNIPLAPFLFFAFALSLI